MKRRPPCTRNTRFRLTGKRRLAAGYGGAHRVRKEALASRVTTVRRNLGRPHEVTAYSVHCRHGAVPMLDIKALLDAGYGDTELVALPLPLRGTFPKHNGMD